jgi:hypothetical protein
MKHIFHSQLTLRIAKLHMRGRTTAFFLPLRVSALIIGVGLFGSLLVTKSASGQETTEDRIVVMGDDIGSAYGAPGAFSRTRFAPLTTSYVLPPWTFYYGTIYEGNAFREGLPDHKFTEEIELGLPYRFGVAAETAFERFNGGGGISTISVEGRYAFADWGKIPLNPTIFAEYKFGVGTIRHEEGPPPPAEEEERKKDRRIVLTLTRFGFCWQTNFGIGRNGR